MDLFLIILLIFVLILISGFFSASETGLTGASKARLHKLEQDGNKRAKITNELRQDKEKLLGAILLGNNLFNITASAIAGGFALATYGQGAVAIATVLLTILVLIFGEVMPKTYAVQNADKVALAVAPIWSVLIKIFAPLTRLIQLISNFLLKIFGLNKVHDMVTGKDELRGAISMQRNEGSVIKEDHDMLRSILDLDDIEVGEVMVHRKFVKSLNIDDEPIKIVKTASRSSHTRLPVWQENAENIIGILNTKDLLKTNLQKPEIEQIKKLIYKPIFVPETTTLNQQLKEFKKQRAHMGVVIDEYGTTMGIITLEDILEEIVGQIDDEHDKTHNGIKKLRNGNYIIEGGISIRDINRELDWQLNEDEASTIAGYIINKAEAIPENGQEFEFEGYKFIITRRVRNEIKKVECFKIAKTEDS